MDVMMVQDAAAKDKSQLPWDFLIGKPEEESYDEDQTLLQHVLFQSQNGLVTEKIEIK